MDGRKNGRRCFRRPRLNLLVIAGFLPVIASARVGAQIYQWEDAVETRHFTNSLETFSKSSRASAEVFVEAHRRPRTDDGAPVSRLGGSSENVEEEAPLAEQAQTVVAEISPDSVDASRIEELTAALEAYVAASQAQRADPVVIMQSPARPLILNPFYDPSGQYYESPYKGRITTPFDRGRSRGLTRRQQLHDRMQAERER